MLISPLYGNLFSQQLASFFEKIMLLSRWMLNSPSAPSLTSIPKTKPKAPKPGPELEPDPTA